MGTKDGSETQSNELRRVRDLIDEARALGGVYEQSSARGIGLLRRWYWTKKNFAMSEEYSTEAIKLFSPDDGAGSRAMSEISE